jgi:outer membrane protein assembly factor BamD
MMDVQAWMRAAGARTGALVLLLALTGACASGPRLPQIDAAQADQFLFDRGPGYLENRNWLYAREYFRRLIDGYPRSPYRSRAKLGVGDSYIGENRTDSFILAANEFREFLQFFPVDPRADYAQYRLAYTYHRQMLSPQRDQTATKDAIRELQVFLDRYKESEYREEVVRLHRDARDRLSESEFRVGLLYFRTRWFQGALGRFGQLLRDDPGYTRRDELYYYTGETFMKVKALTEALPYYERLIAEYPKSPYLARARKRVEEIKRGSRPVRP